MITVNRKESGFVTIECSGKFDANAKYFVGIETKARNSVSDKFFSIEFNYYVKDKNDNKKMPLYALYRVIYDLSSDEDFTPEMVSENRLASAYELFKRDFSLLKEMLLPKNFPIPQSYGEMIK